MKRSILFLLLLGLAVLIAAPEDRIARAQAQSIYEKARKKLVDEAIIGSGVKDKRVIAAMLATERHEFVSFKFRKQAYFDMSLPIGDKQTISSPFIVSYMTQSLDPQPSDKVLEIGTGSGYQAAVLSPLVRDVYTIEIVESLGRKAEQTLQRLNYKNVHVKVGDGFKGWPEHAPFDKIIVTCSPEKAPQPLVEQLKEGGLMVIPVGERYQQTLYLFRKKNGKLEAEALRPTLFVPMTGRAESARVVKPDPLNPKAENGGFEMAPAANGFLSGWYYQRLLTWRTADDAPQGEHYISFRNDEPGRSAHLLQGFPIDGRKVTQLKLSAWVKYENIQSGRTKDELPAVVVSFYDQNRKELGLFGIGPFRNSQAWRRETKEIRVPPRAREGILRIGLFGATGEISFDNVKMEIP